MQQHTYTEQPQRQNFQYYPNPPPPVVYERRYAERDSGPRCVPCCCCIPCIPIPNWSNLMMKKRKKTTKPSR
uniref:Uncharacterized protein n=1 Tax=Globodera pallida TaxID=36090 RepID=A0A183CJX5_GLOPA